MAAIIKKLTESVRMAKENVATARRTLKELPEASTERDSLYQDLVIHRSTRDNLLTTMLKEKQKVQVAKHSKWVLIHVSNIPLRMN
jgi:uncharacterized membrane-anchored protein YhcB (DUF1043 family)